MKTIFIIRHAESLANVGGRTEAHDTIPLSEKGKIQAQKLAEELTVIPNLIVVSPYTRTQETASFFIDKHPSVPVETWNVQEFTYLNPKIYNGTTRDERKDAVKKYWDDLNINYQDSGDVETFKSFIHRIKDFISMVKDRKEETIVIFSHGGFIQNLKAYLDIFSEMKDEELRDENIQELMKMYQNDMREKKLIENVSIHEIHL